MPGARRAATKADKKRVEILRSAAAAFRRRGYHGASVDRIARALRMTKSHLYYYFRDKEEILYFCHDYSVDLLLRLLDDVEKVGGPPEVRLRALLVGFVHMILDELHGTALTMDVQALSPRLLRRVVAKRDRFDRGVRRTVQEGMRSGAFAKGDPKLVTFAILGAVNWITRWYDPKGPARSDEIAEAFASYLLRGLSRERSSRAQSRTISGC
jgi:TetR/AcrR family transcriptional regulator